MLVFVGVASLFLLPLSGDSTDRPVELGESESYVTSGEISTESDGLLVAHEGTVIADDNAHLTFEYGNRTVERVYDDGTVYTKYETTVTDKDWIESIGPTDAEERHFGEHQDRVVRITEENGTVDSSDMTFVRIQTSHHLRNLEYGQGDEQGDRTVYAPSSTWTTVNTETMHASPTAGKLSVDTETGVLREASLQYQLTNASSYGEYLLRLGETTTVDLRYEYDPNPDIDDIETPTWIDQCVENDHCEF
ncbi:hypothetical protein C482_07254 [Natrialba chahannaoensis JCM 10990]|uniref:Uncharacterized protein n=2 Tax=Natrialba chahannaoensis TaxID=68911 RepID=M0AUF2_9EURY|nr:hypothetical protein C482_07254 [Natrialba chahannaoensis JCM 10990]